MFVGIGRQVGGRRLKAAGREIMLMPQLPSVMVLAMVLTDIVMTMVWLLVFGHVHVPVPLVVLCPIHQSMLGLKAVLGIHIEIMADGMAHRRPRGRGSVVRERSSCAGRRGGPILASMLWLLLRIILPGSRLMEPECTICHLTRQAGSY